MDHFNQNNPDGFGGDYDIHVETAEETAARKQMQNLAGNFQHRHQAVMQALQGCCGGASGPVRLSELQERLSPETTDRAAGMAMNRLRGYGLINRRFSGINFGSLDWPLATPGSVFSSRDLSIRLYGTPGVAVLSMQYEPNCWRSYTGPGNVVQQLKPDLYAVTSDGNYEDHWFFEHDAATEPASRIMQKCRLYEDYYNSNMEQNNTGAFPMVVWVVPDEQRKASLQSGVNQSTELQHKELFLFILPDELEALIRKGAGFGF